MAAIFALRYTSTSSASDVFVRRGLVVFATSEAENVSDTGRMGAIATMFDLPRGSAMAYYPEANVLVGTQVDPRSKTPAFKSVPVWIEV